MKKGIVLSKIIELVSLEVRFKTSSVCLQIPYSVFYIRIMSLKDVSETIFDTINLQKYLVVHH